MSIGLLGVPLSHLAVLGSEFDQFAGFARAFVLGQGVLVLAELLLNPTNRGRVCSKCLFVGADGSIQRRLTFPGSFQLLLPNRQIIAPHRVVFDPLPVFSVHVRMSLRPCGRGRVEIVSWIRLSHSCSPSTT